MTERLHGKEEIGNEIRRRCEMISDHLRDLIRHIIQVVSTTHLHEGPAGFHMISSFQYGIIDVSRPQRHIAASNHRPLHPFSPSLFYHSNSIPSHAAVVSVLHSRNTTHSQTKQATPPCRTLRVKRPATCRKQAVAGCFWSSFPNIVCSPPKRQR